MLGAAVFLAPRMGLSEAGEVTIVAGGFRQARTIGSDVRAILRALYDDQWWSAIRRGGPLRLVDHAQAFEVEDREMGALLRCVGSREELLHGGRPALVICDELASWVNGEQRFRVLASGLGKVSGARVVALGTRPTDEEHFWEGMLAGGTSRGRLVDDSGIYVQVHAAPADARIYRRRVWERANPLMSCHSVLASEVASAAAEARQDPQAEAEFRAARLNQGPRSSEVEDANLLLQAIDWRRIQAGGLPERHGPWVGGIDLGGTAALSAIAAVWPLSGRVEVLAACGDDPPLLERGRGDRVGAAYLLAERSGELITGPGRVAPVGGLLESALDRWGAPFALAADRWRRGELYDALNAAGAPQSFGVVWRGQGYRDGSEDVRAFRSAVLRQEIRVSDRAKLLSRSVSGARVMVDPAGNAKLATRNDGGRNWRHRDDMAAALILGCGLAERWHRDAGPLAESWRPEAAAS